MKYLIGIIAAFALLAIIGKKEAEIKALCEELDSLDAVRLAMAEELRFQATPQVARIPFRQINTEH